MARFFLILLVLTASIAAAAQTRDHAPSSLRSASRLKQDRANSENWTYARPGLQLGTYRSVIIDPTVVYTGPDAQFEGVERADRQRYAQMMTDALRTELARSFTVVTAPRADTLRLKVTILGAENTRGGVATATRVTPLGLAASAVQSIAGREGRFTGSLLLALELSDGRSNALQFAAVRRRSPDALDIPATLSTTETVRAISEAVAKDIREKLVEAAGRGG
jgi:hypothetical protein